MTPAFTGCWTVHRTIVDDDVSTPIDCTGSARLESAGAIVLYEESVAYRLGGKPVRATRAYRYRTDGDVISASFADGAPFFVLRLTADGTGSATHQCGADLYVLDLTLRGPTTWQTRWTVTGTKRLRITTQYVRAAIYRDEYDVRP